MARLDWTLISFWSILIGDCRLNCVKKGCTPRPLLPPYSRRQSAHSRLVWAIRTSADNRSRRHLRLESYSYNINRVFSRMFQLLCSFYSRNILYISKMPSTKSLIFELNFTMFSTLFYYTESLMYIRNLWLFTHDFWFKNENIELNTL